MISDVYSPVLDELISDEESEAEGGEVDCRFPGETPRNPRQKRQCNIAENAEVAFNSETRQSVVSEIGFIESPVSNPKPHSIKYNQVLCFTLPSKWYATPTSRFLSLHDKTVDIAAYHMHQLLLLLSIMTKLIGLTDESAGGKTMEDED